jgi:hypothetical protein
MPFSYSSTSWDTSYPLHVNKRAFGRPTVTHRNWTFPRPYLLDPTSAEVGTSKLYMSTSDSRNRSRFFVTRERLISFSAPSTNPLSSSIIRFTCERLLELPCPLASFLSSLSLLVAPPSPALSWFLLLSHPLHSLLYMGFSPIPNAPTRLGALQ